MSAAAEAVATTYFDDSEVATVPVTPALIGCEPRSEIDVRTAPSRVVDAIPRSSITYASLTSIGTELVFRYVDTAFGETDDDRIAASAPARSAGVIVSTSIGRTL